MELYIHPTLKALDLFYGELLYDIEAYTSVAEHLSAIAQRMHIGVRTEYPAIASEINNYYPPMIGKSEKEIFTAGLSVEECHEVIAHEYGYQDWPEVLRECADPYDCTFEAAANDLIHGKYKALQQKLEQQPQLVHQRSPYGHQATLLHYAGSNGVEMWRQRVPQNLSEIVRLLLKMGADKDATMKVYGGDHDTLSMVKTSAHPYAAGVADSVIAALQGV